MKKVKNIRSVSFKEILFYINIWATWCPPCKDEMPSLNSLASHFSAKDLKIIPISVDVSEVLTVRHFYTEFGLDKLSIYVDPSTSVMHAFSVVVFPLPC